MAEPLRGLSSMATTGLLAALSDELRLRRPLTVHFESAGGVEVARNIRAGTRADLAVLSEQEMDDLDGDGFFERGTLRALYVSDVVAAVPNDVAPPSLSTEDELAAALTAAGRIAYSTGPSGIALVQLIERWDLVEVVRPKLVQAEAGTPVGSLLAGGEADLGFQQRSELSDVPGVRVLGTLPGAAAIRSTFSGAVLAASARPQPAGDVLEFLHSDEAERHVLAAGMRIARPG